MESNVHNQETSAQPPQESMNYSNAMFEAVPEKVERAAEDPKDMNTGMLKVDAKPPGSQLLAASALAGLKPVAKQGDEKEEEEVDEECDFEIPLRFTKSGRRRATPFPLKLMKVLSCKKYNHIIAWTPDGTSFSIMRPKAFTTEILPKFFKQAKYSSFTRKLHRWGFQRHLRGADTGAFFHKLFQRGRLDLLDQMTCYKPRDQSRRSGVDTITSGLAAAAAHKQAQQQQQQQQQGAYLEQAQQQLRGMGLPSAELIAEAQAIRRQQQLSMMAQAQQQQQQSLPREMMGMQDVPSAASMPPQYGDDRLNAAIELEVTRRLKERVQAASLSRQAIAMMQQEQQAPPPPPPQQMPYDMGMPYAAASSPATTRSPAARAASLGMYGSGGGGNDFRQQAAALRGRYSLGGGGNYEDQMQPFDPKFGGNTG